MAESKQQEQEEKEEVPEEGMAVIDFDMLCATVALQTQGLPTVKRAKEDEFEEGIDFGGGVQRMWEGEVLDCLDDRRMALETAW